MRTLEEQSGSVILTVSLFLVTLIGFSALVVDVGYVFQEHQRVQMAADAAALAAANMPANASARAATLAQSNGVTSGLTVELGKFSGGAFTPGATPNNAVRTSISTTQSAFFGAVLGFFNLPVSARAVSLFKGNAPHLMGCNDTFNGGGNLSTNGGDLWFHANCGDFTVHGQPPSPATGTLTVTATGNVNPATIGTGGAAKLTIPPIDWAGLQASATVVYAGNKTFTAADLAGKTGVIFVNGNVTLSGGAIAASNVTIVATGTVTVGADITGTLNPSTGSVTVALVSKGDVLVAGGTSVVSDLLVRTEGGFRSNGGGHKTFDNLFVTADGDITSNGKISDFSYTADANANGTGIGLPGAPPRLVM